MLFISKSGEFRDCLQWGILLVPRMCIHCPERLLLQISAFLTCTDSDSRIWRSSILCSTNFQFVSDDTWLSGSNLQVIGEELELDSSRFSFRWYFAEPLSHGTDQPELPPHPSAAQLQYGEHDIVECLFFKVVSSLSHSFHCLNFTVNYVLVAQLCPTLCDPLACSSQGSSVHGILQARILEWIALPFSVGSSQPGDWTQVSHIAGGFFTIWATREAHCELSIG